jgi:hypothetical protein
MQWFEEH